MPERLKRNPLGVEVGIRDGLIWIEWALNQYLEGCRNAVDPRETSNRERHADIILGILPPSMPVRDLKASQVHDFLQYLRDDYRGATGKALSGPYRAKILGTLQRALNEAVYAGYLDANPALIVPPTLRPSQLSPETAILHGGTGQASSLGAPAQRRWDAPADWPRDGPDYLYEQVAFALLTGARRNEVQAQRWEWIDCDAGFVRLYTSKRFRGEDRGEVHRTVVRTVPQWPQLRDTLAALWDRQGKPSSGLVFPLSRPASQWRIHAKPAIERGGESGQCGAQCTSASGRPHRRHGGAARAV